MESTKMGAPTKYREEFNEEARLFCLLTGATDEQLAEHLDVSETTIKNWYKEYPDFLSSVKAGKSGADMNVAEGFYKRATGYQFTETTFEKVDDKLMLEGTPDALVTVDAYRKRIVTKHLPPDAGAALNWLKNRQPEHWRDKVEIAHSGKLDANDLSNLSDIQIRQLLTELEGKLYDESANG
jgi:hypothetical protein